MNLPKIHSISKKICVALLGGFLLIFLLFHAGANMFILRHDDGAWYNAFCHFMGTNWIVKAFADNGNKSLWMAKNTDTYEIDQRGYIMHREATPLLDKMPANDRNRRKIEAASWYSIQDEQAMNAMSDCLIDCSDQISGMDVFQRLYASPWTTAHWLYTHQDSKLIPLLSQEMKTFDNELINTVLESIHDADQKKFIEQLTH